MIGWICAAMAGVLGLLTPPVDSGLTIGDRVAVVIGQNDDGDPRNRLVYADRDAQRVADTLRTRGHFADEDVIVLLDADQATVDAEFAALAGRAPALLVVYYSGHADGTGLRLGDDTLPYATLRKQVYAVGAGSMVVILDACQAEALLRAKGTHTVPIPAAIEWRGQRPEGEILIGSSARVERAFEDERLRGSVFTHHLLAALDGDADGIHAADARVTVGEAFRYAHDRTLREGRRRAVGRQTPWIARDATGDDPPLTFKREDMGDLVLPAGLAGQVSIERPDGGDDVYDKPAGVPLTVWLRAGDYALAVRAGGERRVRPVTIGAGERLVVEASTEGWQRQAWDGAWTQSKGAEPEVGVDVGVGYAITSRWLPSVDAFSGVSGEVSVEHGLWYVGLGGGWATAAAHDGGADAFSGTLSGGLTLAGRGRWGARAGLEVGGGAAFRSYTYADPDTVVYLGGGGRLDGRFGLTSNVYGWLTARMGVRLYEARGVGLQSPLTLSGVAGLGWRWPL